MTFEELKREAKAQGYNLIKIKPYERLLPCTCGCNRREHWVSAKGDSILKCMKCGRTVYGKNDADVRFQWNMEVTAK